MALQATWVAALAGLFTVLGAALHGILGSTELSKIAANSLELVEQLEALRARLAPLLDARRIDDMQDGVEELCRLVTGGSDGMARAAARQGPAAHAMTVRVPADLAHEPAARTARKKPCRSMSSSQASAGTLATAEGPVAYESGDALLTGPAGERWPVPRARFLRDYEVGGRRSRRWAGTLSQETRARCARCAWTGPSPSRCRMGAARCPAMRATGSSQYAPGDQAVVAASIFAATYELVD